MATSLDLTITVGGSSEATARLRSIDQSLEAVGSAASRAGAAFQNVGNSVALGQMQRLRQNFRDTGIAINSASDEIARLTSRMQQVSQNNTFGELSSEAQKLVDKLVETDRAFHLASSQAAKFDEAMREIKKDLGDCNNNLEEMRGEVDKSGSSIQGFLNKAMNFAKGTVIGFGIKEIAESYISFSLACDEAKQRLDAIDSSFKNAFGGQATRLLEGVRTQCAELGLGFQTTAELAHDFFEQGKGTPIAAEMDKVFASLTTAARALNFSDEQLKSLMKDVGDLAQQETVSITDLAEKLGSHLPDALEKSASSMGMTIGEMNTLAYQGKLLTGDVLPQLASALREEYAQAAKDAADTVEGMTMRMSNAWEQFKANLAQSGPAKFVVQFITEGLETLNAGIATYDKNKALIKQLQGAGIAEAGASKHQIGWGTVEQKHYTEDQLANMDFANQALEAGKNIAGQLAKKGQQALVDLNATHERTKAAKKDATQTLIDKTKSDYEAAKSYLKSTGASPEDLKALEQQKDEIIRELGAQQMRLAKLMAGGLGGTKGAKSAATAAHKAAVAEADYAAKLKASEAQLAKLEAQAGKTGSVEQYLALEKTRIEAEYQAQLDKNTKEYVSLSGKMKASDLDQYKVANDRVALMERDLKLKQAEKSATEKNAQITQGQIRFYKELDKLSGNYGNSIDLQNQLIRKQAREFEDTYHISHELVEEWERLQRLEISDDPFDGITRGLLKFNAEYQDSAKEWESIAYNFGKSFMSTTRNIFGDFIDTGKASFDSFKSLFRQLLKDLMWQALVNPVMVSIVGGVSGALYGGSTVQAGTGGQIAGAASGAGGSGDIFSAAVSFGQQQALGHVKNQLFGSGSGSLVGGITDSINSAVASWFPNTFASSTGNAALNAATIAEHEMAMVATPNLPTTTFTQSAGQFLGNFASPAIGAGIGSLASPFINSALGLQNNSGSQIGSLVGGLGTTAVLGTLALTNAWNPVGWVSGGLAALGSIIGGGIGSLFGGGPKQEPKLEVDLNAALWNPLGEISDTSTGSGASLKSGSKAGWWLGVETTRGADGQVGYANDFASIAQALHEQSWAIADALGQTSAAMQKQYLQGLEAQGVINQHAIHKGDYINEEQIQNTLEAFINKSTDAMFRALGNIDLTPLTLTAEGKAAKTQKELARAFGQIFDFVNISQTIEDEEKRAQFAEQAIRQMTNALNGVSFAPLARTADGFAVKAMDELTASLEDMFSLYDLSESLQDANAKAAFQKWAQEEIIAAFSEIDLSFLRVDFDKSTFTGMQQAYAAAQAWKAVEDGINAVIAPANEFDTAMRAAADQFDQWLDNLRNLGWQEDALAEVEAKRGRYLAEIQRQLEQEMRQSLALRASSLRYGSDSMQYALQSLLFQQANEREQWASQFGEDHPLYQYGTAIQQTELTKTLLDQFKAMRDELLAQEREYQQKALNERMSALQTEISAQQKLANEAEQLANRFRRLARTLEEYRRDLWSGQDNLSTSRYSEAYRQFDEYYQKALAGDEDAFGALKDKAGELLQLGRDQLGSRDEYRDLFYDVDQKLKDAQLYAENQVTEADRQLQALNAILENLDRQQTTLQAQLDALNVQTVADVKSMFTLGEIESAIAMLDGLFNRQVDQVAPTNISWDWERLLREKAAEWSSYAYRGNESWTTSQVRQEISSMGMTVEQWFSEVASREGYTLHAIETTNATLDRNASLDRKLAEQNTSTLNDSLTRQIGAIATGNESIGSLLNVSSSFFPEAINSMGGLNAGLSSIFTGVTGVNTGVGAVNSSLGGVNLGIGSVNSSLGGMDSGLSSINGSMNGVTSGLNSIYRAIVEMAAGNTSISGSFEGVTVEYKGNTAQYLGASTNYTPSTGNYNGTGSGVASGTGERVPLGTGLWGSTFTSEYDLLVAKTRSLNLTNYEGRNDWTPARTKQYIVDYVQSNYPGTSASSALEKWYRGAGYYEQQWGKYAKGGIAPANEPYLVGEAGPEIVVAPQQYGILNHKASMAIAGVGIDALMSGRRNDGPDVGEELKSGFALLAGYLRQIVVKTDNTAYSSDKAMNVLREWNDTGVPTPTDDRAELYTVIRQGFAMLSELIAQKREENDENGGSEETGGEEAETTA